MASIRFPRLRGALCAAALVACAAAHAQDAAAGGMAFLQCSDCHATGTSNGVGPGLKGVVGRKAGVADGFAFSAPLKASGLTWDAKTLDAWLASPQKRVPGTTMAFPGVSDAKERADLIAYLATLK